MNKRCHFLNEHELIRIREIDMDAGGAVNLELITWVLADVKKAQTDGHIDSLQSNQMREYVIEFRRAYADLANIADQLISFFYVHFIILLSSLYLPLFAVSAAYNVGGKDVDWSVNLIGGLTVWLQTIFVIGLRTLGLVLQDPFGSDVEDLSVIHYVNFTWKVSNRILAGNNPNPLDIGVEEEVIVSRAPLGAAWDPVSKTVAAEKAMSKSNLDPHNYEDEDDEEGGLTSVEGVEIMITPSSKNKS
jgi:predicted membrane chloride channel (bestrophin family)